VLAPQGDDSVRVPYGDSSVMCVAQCAHTQINVSAIRLQQFISLTGSIRARRCSCVCAPAASMCHELLIHDSSRRVQPDVPNTGRWAEMAKPD
jgi:hypothetical protein